MCWMDLSLPQLLGVKIKTLKPPQSNTNMYGGAATWLLQVPSDFWILTASSNFVFGKGPP